MINNIVLCSSRFSLDFLEKTNSIGDGDDDDDAGAVISSLASPATNCKETLIIYSIHMIEHYRYYK
jgi:hypothetical protein